MQGTVVGVLRGGPSHEHDVSLKTGQNMLGSLPDDIYTVRDIYIDKQGVWHERGRPTSPERVLHSIDVALIGLHGSYGEDGQVQRLLEQFGVPYTGANSFSSYIAMHKVFAKERAKEIGLLTPRYEYIESREGMEEKLKGVVRSFMQPVVVKPVGSGSSVGVSLVHGYDTLRKELDSLLNTHPGVLIEERILGREATVGVVEDMRGESLYALPPVEIIVPSSHKFFSYDAKYDGGTKEICPAPFSKKVSSELAKAARAIHEALGLRHYSRSDFIISPKGIYYLETNTLPGLTSESLFPRSLAAVGMKVSDFLSHIINLALRK